MRTNIDRMRELDMAWNERRWVDVEDLLSIKLITHVDGRGEIVGRDDYLKKEKAFCGACPDARLHSEPYLTIFSSADGRRTASIARMTGTYNVRSVQSDGNARNIEKPFDVRVAVVCAWTNGVVTEQYRFVDPFPSVGLLLHA